MDVEIHKSWRSEVEHFILRWENEAETISKKTLHPMECGRISDHFHKDFEGLLVRRPLGTSDEDIVIRLEELDNKLTSMLAMACG